jgi:hypothetical protein
LAAGPIWYVGARFFTLLALHHSTLEYIMAVIDYYFTYGLRMVPKKQDPVVDNKARLEEQIKLYVRERREYALPPDWEFLAESLQRWWLQEQRVMYLRERMQECQRGLDNYDYWVETLHRSIDNYNIWYEARYDPDIYGGPAPEEAQRELEEYMLARSRDLSNESDNRKKREQQMAYLRDMIEDEEEKLARLQKKISKPELDMRREDNRARKERKNAKREWSWSASDELEELKKRKPSVLDFFGKGEKK